MFFEKNDLEYENEKTGINLQLEAIVRFKSKPKACKTQNCVGENN